MAETLMPAYSDQEALDYFNCSKSLSNVDLNDVVVTGNYLLGGTITNNFGGTNYGYLYVYKYNNDAVRQIGTPLNSDKMYIRNYYNGTWSNWKELALNDEIPEVVNALNSDSTTSALSAAQGKALNSKITTITKGNKNLYTTPSTYVDVAGGATIQLAEGSSNWRIITIRFSSESPVTSSSQGTVTVATCDANGNYYYPVTMSNTFGIVRFKVQENDIVFLNATTFTHLYVISIIGSIHV